MKAGSKSDSFNDNHPEIQEGEVFLSNTSIVDFDRIGWKTKRMGFYGYTREGDRISSNEKIYPVFVQKSELLRVKGRE